MIRIIIRGVEERREFIEYLRARLPLAELVMDAKRSAMDTFVRSLKLAGGDPVILMEDDIVITRDFVQKAEAAIAQRPHEQIQFFSMRIDDIRIGSRYDRKFMMNQCHYMPPGACADLLAYSAIWRAKNTASEHYDTMMQGWHRARGLRYWIHVPSLVDHRVSRSFIDGRRSSKRQSKTFVDPWL